MDVFYHPYHLTKVKFSGEMLLLLCGLTADLCVGGTNPRFNISFVQVFAVAVYKVRC